MSWVNKNTKPLSKEDIMAKYESLVHQEYRAAKAWEEKAPTPPPALKEEEPNIKEHIERRPIKL